eukprot:g14665.t1
MVIMVNEDIEMEKINSPSVKLLELFSGVGGMRFGLAYAGLRIDQENSLAVDINADALAVYRHNFSSSSSSGAAVAQRSRAESVDLATAGVSFFRNYDVWTMSPPCQPFTRQGKQKGTEDNRCDAFLNVLKALQELSSEALPKFLVLENVKGFEESDACDGLLDVLHKRGYDAWAFLLSPERFGFPNSRLRSDVHIPNPTLDKKSAWALDVVFPECQHSMCVTKAYGSILVCRFDLNVGQLCEWECDTATPLSDAEKKLCALLAFPDTHLFAHKRHYESCFSFRVRAGNHDQPEQNNYLVAASFFRQEPDPSSARGASQKAVVVVTNHDGGEFACLLKQICYVIGPLFFEHGGEKILETAVIHASLVNETGAASTHFLEGSEMTRYAADSEVQLPEDDQVQVLRKSKTYPYSGSTTTAAPAAAQQNQKSGGVGEQVSPRKHSVLYGSDRSPNLRALSINLDKQSYDGAARNLWTRLGEYGPEMLWTLWELALTGESIVIFGSGGAGAPCSAALSEVPFVPGAGVRKVDRVFNFKLERDECDVFFSCIFTLR